MWEWRQGKKGHKGKEEDAWLFQWGICGRKGRGTQNILVSTFPSASTTPRSIFCLDGLPFKAMLFLRTLRTEPHSPCVHPARKWFVIVFWTFKSPSAPFQPLLHISHCSHAPLVSRKGTSAPGSEPWGQAGSWTRPQSGYQCCCFYPRSCIGWFSYSFSWAFTVSNLTWLSSLKKKSASPGSP